MRVMLVLVLGLLTLPIKALSDDLLSCVDPDVVTALLGFGYQPGSKVTDEVPQEFSTLRFPSSYSLVGSLSSDHLVSIAYRAGLDSQDARTEIFELLRQSGWRPMRKQEGEMRTGFQPAPTASPDPLSLCHSSGDRVSVLVREDDRGSLVTVYRPVERRGRNCNEEAGPSRRIRWGFTDDLMPYLELPADSRRHGGGGGGVIQGSGDDADADVRVTTDLQPVELLEHFAAQLATQGWLPGSSWASEESLGSTWSLEREGLPKTVGNLQLVTHSPGDYSLKFSMIAL